MLLRVLVLLWVLSLLRPLLMLLPLLMRLTLSLLRLVKQLLKSDADEALFRSRPPSQILTRSLLLRLTLVVCWPLLPPLLLLPPLPLLPLPPLPLLPPPLPLLFPSRVCLCVQLPGGLGAHRRSGAPLPHQHGPRPARQRLSGRLVN